MISNLSQHSDPTPGAHYPRAPQPSHIAALAVGLFVPSALINMAGNVPVIHPTPGKSKNRASQFGKVRTLSRDATTITRHYHDLVRVVVLEALRRALPDQLPF